MNWLQQLLNPKEAEREASREAQSTNMATGARLDGAKSEAVRKKRSKKRIWIISSIIVIAAATGTYFMMQGKGGNKDWKKDATVVKRGKATLKVIATGIIKPVREVKISPKQTGLLKELYVQQGDRVKRGQIIALMDDSNLLGQIAAAKGAYLSSVENSKKLKRGNRPQEVLAARFQKQRAREGVRNAEQNISRLSAQMEALKAQLRRNEQFAKAQAFLAKSGAISEQTSIDAETAAHVTRAQLEAAERELGQARVAKAQSEADSEALEQQYNLMKSGFRAEDVAAAYHASEQSKGNLQYLESLRNDTRIKAPFDGIITQKYADSGAIVTPTTSAATTSATSSSIVALAGRLEMVAQVSEANVPKIRIGQEVEIVATSFPDKTYHGKVTQIAPAAIVTMNVTTFEVHAEITDDPDNKLLSGMNVSAGFLVGEQDDALMIPAVCVVSRRGESGVYVPDKEGNPEFKKVKTGASVDRDIVVLAGLKEGDYVFKGLSKEHLEKEGYLGRGGGMGGGMGGMGGGRGGGGRGGGGGMIPRGFGR